MHVRQCCHYWVTTYLPASTPLSCPPMTLCIIDRKPGSVTTYLNRSCTKRRLWSGLSSEMRTTCSRSDGGRISAFGQEGKDIPAYVLNASVYLDGLIDCDRKTVSHLWSSEMELNFNRRLGPGVVSQIYDALTLTPAYLASRPRKKEALESRGSCPWS